MEQRGLRQGDNKGDNKGDKYSPPKKKETTSSNIERKAAEEARNRTPQAGESSSFFGYFLKKLGMASSSPSDIKPARNLEEERIALRNRTIKMPLLDQRKENQEWLDSIKNKVDRDNQAKKVLSAEYNSLTYRTMGGRRGIAGTGMMSIEQRREKHQEWLDSLPQEYKDAQSKIVLADEAGTMLYLTKDMPGEQKKQQYQEWLDGVPQEYKDAQSKIVLSSKLESMLSITKNILDEQTKQQRQEWLKSIPQRRQEWLKSLPQEYKDAISGIVISSEAEGVLSITKNIPDKQKKREQQEWLKSVPEIYKGTMSSIFFYAQK
jgi:hypothetical protein